jgi:hypothetical protein
MLGKISTGAVNDLERVTQMAYSQVRGGGRVARSLEGGGGRAVLLLFTREHVPRSTSSRVRLCVCVCVCGPGTQVAVYGMNERVGLVSFRMDREALDKPYSDTTAQLIDEEVRGRRSRGGREKGL